MVACIQREDENTRRQLECSDATSLIRIGTGCPREHRREKAKGNRRDGPGLDKLHPILFLSVPENSGLDS